MLKSLIITLLTANVAGNKDEQCVEEYTDVPKWFEMKNECIEKCPNLWDDFEQGHSRFRTVSPSVAWEEYEKLVEA